MALQNISGLGLGIVALAIVVVVGSVVVQELGNSVGGDANASAVYAITELGSAGLLGWLPAIVAMTVGVMFLAYFMGRGRSY